MKKIIIAAFGAMLVMNSYAQNEQDVLRFSQNSLFGSARVQGAGGAFGALGTDASAIAINPAGIGLYRRNEISGSLGITAYSNDSKYIGNTSTESKVNLNIPQFGIVINKMQQGFNGDEQEGLVGYSFGFGLNRLNDFQQNNYFTGINTKTSISDFFAERANGRFFSPSSTLQSYINDLGGMAWNNYMIDSVGVNRYASTFVSQNDTAFSIRQSNINKLSGRINEWNFSAGINISNFVYFGASLLFQNVNYESNNVFNENVLTKSRVSNTYQSSRFSSNVTTQGTGVGGRFGVIVRPSDYFRVGASYTTAVRLNLKDEYSYGLSAVGNANNYTYTTNDRKDFFEYDVVTPSKLTLSGALMHPKLGFLSIDWDRVDYSAARLTSGTEEFYNANQQIKTLYAVANNVRVGAELRYKDARFRAGYATYGSPFSSNSKGIVLNEPTQSITAGLGFIFPSIDRFASDFFIDGAMTYTWSKSYQTPYELKQAGKVNYSAENQITFMNFMLTAGYRF